MGTTALQVVDGGAIASIAPERNPPAVDFAAVMAFANELIGSGFLPDWIKTGGQAAATILAGQELGMPPMLALRSITSVKGKIVVSADAQLALFKKAGGRAHFDELTDTRAVLVLQHPNGDGHTETFTIDDAKRAGLLNNTNWKNFPKAMLRSRAITAGLKSVGFEPTSGVYDPDEAQHFTGTPAITSAATDTRDSEEMTLEDALAMTVSDNHTAWKGKGGDLLSSYDSPHLSQLRDWFEEKLLDGHRDDFAARVEAITLILDDREKDQTKLPRDGKPATQQAAESGPGNVAKALTPADDIPAPTPEQAKRVHQKARGNAVMDEQDYVPAIDEPADDPDQTPF